LWTNIEHDWRRPVVLPTLRVAPSGYTSTVRVMTDIDRRERLSFAIRAAMNGRTAEAIASAMDPHRSKETVARWARGETVPSALDIEPLAAALGVKPILLVSPPALPDYPLADYLVESAVQAGQAEGARRADNQGARVRGKRPRSPERPAHADEAGHG
jgi:transcriptional regulator with XRE-family HTH domain